MTAPRIYPDAEVATWQPRARHYYHQAGTWNGAAYIAWIDAQVKAFAAEHGVPAEHRLHIYQAEFTAWLSARCTCGGAK